MIKSLICRACPAAASLPEVGFILSLGTRRDTRRTNSRLGPSSFGYITSILDGKILKHAKCILLRVTASNAWSNNERDKLILVLGANKR